MDYNDHKYMIVAPSTLGIISEAHIVGSKDTARWNLAGTKAVVEVAPTSAYYSLSFAKSHEETLAIMNTPEWALPEF
jgi:hypothetical protein